MDSRDIGYVGLVIVVVVVVPVVPVLFLTDHQAMKAYWGVEV
jgi:hypothetical protein